MKNNVGRLARKLYLSMRRSAAAVKIQKNLRRHISIKSYKKLQSSAITLQSGLRKMSACNDFRFKKQTKAAIIIQVHCVCIILLFMCNTNHL